jgi:hypothetical protein
MSQIRAMRVHKKEKHIEENTKNQRIISLLKKRKKKND